MLNPDLYRMLQARFGEVKITKEDVTSEYSINKVGDRFYGEVTYDGENYKVNCPFCTDKRFRLYVSYLYGATLREDGKLICFGHHMANCFNETQCMSDGNNQKDLMDMIFEGGVVLTAPIVREHREKPKVRYPAVAPLSSLPNDHPAIQYIQGRGFKISTFEERNIGFCIDDPNSNIVNRLFIPIYDLDGRLVGGQCRLIYDSDRKYPPKYYTLFHTPLGKCLYNAQTAKQHKTVVVTEGIFDALRVGSHGVATFGGSIGSMQRTLLTNWSIVIIAFDPTLEEEDAAKYAALEKTELVLRQKGVIVGRLLLPDGKDPGETDHKTLVGLINDKILSLQKEFTR